MAQCEAELFLIDFHCLFELELPLESIQHVNKILIPIETANEHGGRGCSGLAGRMSPGAKSVFQLTIEFINRISSFANYFTSLSFARRTSKPEINSFLSLWRRNLFEMIHEPVFGWHPELPTISYHFMGAHTLLGPDLNTMNPGNRPLSSPGSAGHQLS